MRTELYNFYLQAILNNNYKNHGTETGMTRQQYTYGKELGDPAGPVRVALPEFIAAKSAAESIKNSPLIKVLEECGDD